MQQPTSRFPVQMVQLLVVQFTLLISMNLWLAFPSFQLLDIDDGAELEIP
jgi:hypothetical protein